MTNEMLFTAPSRRRSGRAIEGTILAVGLILAGSPAPGQSQETPTAADTIMARKLVMDTLSDKMDAIELMISSDKIDLNAGQADANDVSVYLTAFPLLFPPSTNQWKPNVDKDPITDTFAAPDVWTKFADFYRQATAAAKAAFTASRAQNDNDFKAAVAQLRTGCNACHAAYMKMD